MSKTKLVKYEKVKAFDIKFKDGPTRSSKTIKNEDNSMMLVKEILVRKKPGANNHIILEILRPLSGQFEVVEIKKGDKK